MFLLATSSHDSKLFKVAPQHLSLFIEVETDTHIQPYTQNIKICETANVCKTVSMLNVRILKVNFFITRSLRQSKISARTYQLEGHFDVNELIYMDYIENDRRKLCEFHHSSEEMKCQLVPWYRANWPNRTVLISPIVPC